MGMRICLGCLNEVTDETSRCPLCSFSLEDPVSDNVLEPTTVLNNRYVVGKALEVDGEGITYIGFDADLKDAVIIREYFPNSISVRQDKKIVVNDGKIATFKSLKSEFIDLHKNLAKFNGINLIANTRQIFEQNGSVYATSDYLIGITLDKYLKENAGELDWYEIKDMFKSFMEDLSKINKAGYIHRGISINTILINDNSLHLIGFKTCSAKVLNTEITSKVEDGYAAPEQYKVLPNGEWTDVYGVSAVLYRTLTGTRPAISTSRSVNDNLIDPIRLNSTIPESVSKAIMAGLRYDPRQRVKDIDQLSMLIYSNSFEQTNVISSAKNPLFDPYDENNTDTTKYTQINKKKGFIDSLFDETEEVYEQSDKDFNKSNNRDKKKKKSLLTKVLIGSIPVIVILALILYQLLVGFPFLDGGKNKNKDNSNSSNTSSDISSDDSSEESSVTQNSKPVVQESSQEKPKGNPVENFVGMPYDAITSYTSKFSFGEPSYVFDDKYIEGQICAQSVPAGTLVTPNQIIILSVSKGPRYLTLPNTKNKTAEEYKQYLKEYYKIESTIVDEYSDTVEIDRVIDTFPQQGTRIDRSADIVVKIYRSKGRKPSKNENSNTSTNENSNHNSSQNSSSNSQSNSNTTTE